MSLESDLGYMTLVILVTAGGGCQSRTMNGAELAESDTRSIAMNAVAVAPGVDETLCATVRIPADLDVVALSAQPTAGTHHLILYRSTETEVHGAAACDSMTALEENTPLFVAQDQPTRVQLPAGAAYHFDAGELVKLELHALNATTHPLSIAAVVSLTLAVRGAVVERAGVLSCGSNEQLRSAGLAPRQRSIALAPGFFAGNATVDFTRIRVFGLAAHQHWTGSEVTLAQASAVDGAATLLYDNTTWNTPGLTTFDDRHDLTFAPGEGLRWQCHYDTVDAVPPPTSTVYFGDRPLLDEVCYAWIYYAPAPPGLADCG